MHVESVHNAVIYADARRRDFLAEARHARRINEAVRARTERPVRVSMLRLARQRIGAALVQAGERLQPAGSQAGSPRLASAVVVRTAR